jgi:serine/threonine protein kinase
MFALSLFICKMDLKSIRKKKIKNYIILKTLGQGTFGKVKLGQHIPTK